MSPMYNPDDWSEEFDIVLKYEPMSSSTINKILTQYKHDEVLNYIKELWNLIDYQRKLLNEQTKQIVALKHKESWKRYDLPEQSFKVSVDKPPKSGNMSC
jgi:hypothetical protein